MKPKFRSLISAFAPLQRSSLIVVASLCVANFAHAASQTWDGDTDATWDTTINWVDDAGVPGAVNPAAGALSADVATFNSALVGGTRGGSTDPILIDHQRQVRSVLFDTANAGPYVLSNAVLGNQFWLGHTGNVTVGADVNSAQSISADTQVRLPSSTNGLYSIINNATSSAATLTFSGTVSSGAAGSRPLALTLDGSNTGNNTISGVLTHGGGQRIDLIKNGAGTWILSGSNDFGANTTPTDAGSTTINGGKLIVTNNNALSFNDEDANAINANINTATLEISGSGLVMNNGLSLNLNNGSAIQSVGTNATNGRINVGTAASTSVTISAVGASDVFTVGNGTNDFAGGSATSTVNIGGAGTVLFAQASNYAGGISIGNGSTLRTDSDTALGAAASSNLTFVGNGKLQIGSGATGRNNTVTALNSNSLTVIESGSTATSTLTVNLASGTTTYVGLLQNGAGTLALAKSGLGTLTLNGTHTYTGATLVRGGTLNLDYSAVTAPASGIINSSSALTLGGGAGGATGSPAGQLAITGKDSTANTQTFSNLAIGAGANKITLTPGASGGTVGLTITNAVTVPAGNSHGTLHYGTTGTTSLAGNLSAASFANSGGLYATYGTDDYAATNGSGVVGAATYVNVTTASAAGINNIQGNVTQASGAADPTALRFANATGYTFTNNDASFFLGSILVASTSGSASFTGQHIRSNGSSGDPNRDFYLIQNSPNAFTMAAALDNNTTGRSMSLVKSGTGTVILTASNGYTLGTYINEGTVQVGAGVGGGLTGALGTGGVSNYGALIFNRSDALTSTNVISGTGTLAQSGAGTTTLSVANSFTGNIDVNAGILAGSLGNNFFNPTTSSFGNPQTAGRNININNGGTLRFDAGDVLGGATSTIISGLVVNAGGMVTNTAGVFNSLGPVTLNGGTLTGLGGAVPGYQLYRFNGSVTVGGSTASTISGSGSNAGYHLGANTTFTVADVTGSSATDLTVSGVLINQTDSQTPAGAAGGLTKTGAGTMTLSGINTYTGNTSVQGGTLVLADNAGLTFKPGAPGVTNSISGTGTETLTLDGDFNMDLTNPAAFVNGGSWVLVNVGTFAGNPFTGNFTVTNEFIEAANVWTKVDGGKTWTFTEATGTLSLALAGYAGWAGPNAGGQLANGDFDSDGVSNGVEYFMNAAAGFTANPALNGSNVISWTNGGNIAPGAYGTEFVVQTSNDLAVWVDVPVGSLTANTTGLLSYTLTGTAPRFVRLMVTPN